MTNKIAVSKNNSSIIPLGAGASFIGYTDNLSSFLEIDISLAGMPVNAPGTLCFEFSSDGIDWDVSVPISLLGPSIIPTPLRIILPFFRVKYINGATPLTEFRLTSVYHKECSIRTTRLLSQTIDPNEPLEVSRIAKSVLPDGAATEATLLDISSKLDGYVDLNVTVGTVAQGPSGNDPWPIIPFDTNGIKLPIEDGYSIPFGTSGLLIAGKDEIDVSRFINVDGYGSIIITGTGPAGTVPVNISSIEGLVIDFPDGISTETTLSELNDKFTTVINDASIPPGTTGLVIAGKDEIDVTRFLNVDGYGSPIIVGTGPSNSVQISGIVNQGTAGVTPWPVDIQGATVSVSNLQQLSVETKLSVNNYDIDAASYSANVTFAEDSLLSVLELRFSSTASRDIEISLNNGIILFSETSNNSLLFEVNFEDYAIDSGTILTLIISQTSSPCLIDITLTAKIGTASLGGNPVLGPGANHIGSISIDANANTGSADAFGRLRTSNPQSLFEITHQYDLAPRLMGLQRQDAGTTITHTSPTAVLEVPAIAGRKIVHQSHQYILYLAGKSHLVRITGQLGSGTSISGMGYGDDNDGIFLENGANGPQIRFLSSTISDQLILQNEWNLDILDGYGVSGFTLNINFTQQLIIDFSWLGAGRVRVGLDIGGVIVYIHQFAFSNSVSVPYMRTGSLPVRWYLESLGSVANMLAICASVASEGGSDPIVTEYASARSTTKATLGAGVRTPLISLRPKATFGGLINNVHLVLSNIAFLSSTADNLLVEIIKNGSLTAGSFASVDVDSHAEIDQSATAITGGRVIFGDYVSSQSRGLLSVAPNVNLKTLPLTLSASGVPDVVTICVTRIEATANCYAGFNWKEVH